MKVIASLIMAAAFLVVGTGASRAQEAGPELRQTEPLIVDASRAHGLDQESLRNAVSVATSRPVILSTDPTAADPSKSSAAGDRILVVVSGDRLHVRYDARSIERDVPLESTAQGRAKQVALLVANLTGAEADELLARMHREPTSPSAGSKPRPPLVDEAAEHDYRALEATLRYHMEADRASITATSIAEVAVAGAVIPTSLLIRNRLDETAAGSFLLGIGVGFGAVGALGLFADASRHSALDSIHEHLVTQYGTRPTREVVAVAESEWAAHARFARTKRKWITGIAIGVGAIGLGAGTTIAAATDPHSARDSGRGAVSAIVIGLSAPLLVGGIGGLLTPWPEERYYEGYLRSTGRFSIAPAIAPTQGGASFSLTGKF